MNQVETQVTEETGSMAGFRVEFFIGGGEKVSVLLRPYSDLSREAAVDKARELLAQLGVEENEGPPPVQSNGEDMR